MCLLSVTMTSLQYVNNVISKSCIHSLYLDLSMPKQEMQEMWVDPWVWKIPWRRK